MWNTVLAINSFFIFPATFVFFVYALGRGILTWHWHMLVVAAIFFLFSIVFGVIVGMIDG